MNVKREFHLQISNWDAAMTKRPSLETERLLLRPFNVSDATRVQKLANCREVTDTTLNLPYPYKLQDARKWIATHETLYEKKQQAIFAITARAKQELIGAIGLAKNAAHARAELGYWIGHEYWNRGFATEAARAVIEFGFSKLNLNRIFAHFMVQNPASGKVMQKVGMQFEGELRQHVIKNGRPLDLHIYSILKSDWLKGAIK